MRKRPLSIAAILALSLFLFGFRNHVPRVFDNTIEEHAENGCSSENKAFQVGEEVKFKIYYNWNFVWLAAGEVVFRVNELEDMYHITVDGNTYKSYEWFYRVHDRYESYIDKETLLPKVFIRDVEQGSYRKYNKFIFDHEEDKVIAHVGKSKETIRVDSLEVASCMHDMISIIYFVRNMDFDQLQEGGAFPIDVFLEEEYPMQVRVLSKDVKKRVKGLGKFKVHQFSPGLWDERVFGEGAHMKVWITNDENRLPVMIESPVTVGSVKAVVTEVNGLKYPLKAKIK